jgi:hypothetical protein
VSTCIHCSSWNMPRVKICVFCGGAIGKQPKKREPKPKTHKLTPRETVQIIAALRYWGRAAETSQVHPCNHSQVAARFGPYAPMTLDELETLIGRLDGSFTGRGLRPWGPWKYL